MATSPRVVLDAMRRVRAQRRPTRWQAWRIPIVLGGASMVLALLAWVVAANPDFGRLHLPAVLPPQMLKPIASQGLREVVQKSQPAPSCDGYGIDTDPFLARFGGTFCVSSRYWTNRSRPANLANYIQQVDIFQKFFATEEGCTNYMQRFWGLYMNDPLPSYVYKDAKVALNTVGDEVHVWFWDPFGDEKPDHSSMPAAYHAKHIVLTFRSKAMFAVIRMHGFSESPADLLTPELAIKLAGLIQERYESAQPSPFAVTVRHVVFNPVNRCVEFMAKFGIFKHILSGTTVLLVAFFVRGYTRPVGKSTTGPVSTTIERASATPSTESRKQSKVRSHATPTTTPRSKRAAVGPAPETVASATPKDTVAGESESTSTRVSVLKLVPSETPTARASPATVRPSTSSLDMEVSATLAVAETEDVVFNTKPIEVSDIAIAALPTPAAVEDVVDWIREREAKEFLTPQRSTPVSLVADEASARTPLPSLSASSRTLTPIAHSPSKFPVPPEPASVTPVVLVDDALPLPDPSPFCTPSPSTVPSPVKDTLRASSCSSSDAAGTATTPSDVADSAVGESKPGSPPAGSSCSRSSDDDLPKMSPVVPVVRRRRVRDQGDFQGKSRTRSPAVKPLNVPSPRSGTPRSTTLSTPTAASDVFPQWLPMDAPEPKIPSPVPTPPDHTGAYTDVHADTRSKAFLNPSAMPFVPNAYSRPHNDPRQLSLPSLYVANGVAYVPCMEPDTGLLMLTPVSFFIGNPYGTGRPY